MSRRNKYTKQFTVLVDMPRGVSMKEMKEYMHTAIVAWGKGGHPDNPLFDLRDSHVKVTSTRQLKDHWIGKRITKPLVFK